MANNAASQSLRNRHKIATPRSLANAEMAITDGRRTIGEIAEMVEMDVGKGGSFGDPLRDDFPGVVQSAPLTVSAVCQAMFGMSLGPLMFCVSCLGSVAGVVLGFVSNRTPLQQSITAVIGALF